VDGEMSRLVLRPYHTSSTYRNLKRTGAGVFHVTDDVLLLAKAAVGEASAAVERAACVEGFVLENCCRFYEFEVRQLDDSTERTTIDVDVVRSGRKRDFFGFNRGKHAVVEAAILATRTRILAMHEIIGEFEKLAVLVDKTGGTREREAFALLKKFVQQETKGAQRTSAMGVAVF